MDELTELDKVLSAYQNSFKAKKIVSTEAETDILMQVFGITAKQKLENMQYWGRELGKCWEKLVQITLSSNGNYKGPLPDGRDEICDCRFGKYAIDLKYRVGSGDSGTLKKFKQNAKKLKEMEYTPLMLFLREDNLVAAITAIKNGGWEIKTGDESFEFIKKLNKFDLKQYLQSKSSKFLV